MVALGTQLARPVAPGAPGAVAQLARRKHRRDNVQTRRGPLLSIVRGGCRMLV